MLGPTRTVHMHDISAVQRQHPHSCGLRPSDNSRAGYLAMDWPSAVRVVSTPCLGAFEQAMSGAGGLGPNPGLSGTYEYLKLVHRHVAMFMSTKLSLGVRVRSAGYVVMFLRLWRLWVVATPGKTLEQNFISRECYLDALIACHFVVLLMMLHRDYSPNIPINLSRTGTDCVEDLFSELGSMVRNKRVYSFLGAVCGTNSRNLVQEHSQHRTCGGGAS